MNKPAPTAVDLFAGAGGFGLGFRMAGFQVPLAVEMDAWACATQRHNHPATRVLEADIRDFHGEPTVRELCPARPDVLIGGPPCQGFSVAGPAAKDPADPRNSLFRDFVRWVEVLRPKVFIMENVKGLLARRNAAGTSVATIIRESFAAVGYRVHDVWLLNAADYGVPQVRERVFFVGSPTCGEPLGPPPVTHRRTGAESGEEGELFQVRSLGAPPVPTLWDAISDLPELPAGGGAEEQPYAGEPQTEFQRWARHGSDRLFNHAPMSHSPRLVERFKHIGWGQSGADVPAEHGTQRRNGQGALSAKAYDQNNRRLRPDRPSHTIAASFYANFVHPYQHRNLTAREGARLQSFPDAYRFLGKKTVVSQKLLRREERTDEQFLCQYNQIGNAVPPLLARAIARHLAAAFDL